MTYYSLLLCNLFKNKFALGRAWSSHPSRWQHCRDRRSWRRCWQTMGFVPSSGWTHCLDRPLSPLSHISKIFSQDDFLLSMPNNCVEQKNKLAKQTFFMFKTFWSLASFSNNVRSETCVNIKYIAKLATTSFLLSFHAFVTPMKWGWVGSKHLAQCKKLSIYWS